MRNIIIIILSIIVCFIVGLLGAEINKNNKNQVKKNESIVIVAMPKSASSYIATKVAQELNYTQMQARQWKNKEVINNFNIGMPKLIIIHSFPSTDNITKLRRHSNQKIVVHTRDPRAAILSGVHYVTEKIEKKLPDIPAMPTFPHGDRDPDFWRQFMNLSFEQKTDVLIENVFAYRIKWVQEWCKQKEIEDRKPNGLRILLTSYEDMLQDEEMFFDKIYDHLEKNSERRKNIVIAKDELVKYRKGDPQEWRHVMTNAQIERMNSMLPEELSNKFGWQY